ncbi:hypothetical protein ZIOFF_071184 [Zingiber officinale]|uniref:Uncharacterized protein n=1 Tax=Zingiber officinale TaxID=94328 RepID=A0A8J5C964_ZINOF|nr:hypothetical protein ZIOFF_071184 [Zingiber officinale]
MSEGVHLLLGVQDDTYLSLCQRLKYMEKRCCMFLGEEELQEHHHLQMTIHQLALDADHMMNTDDTGLHMGGCCGQCLSCVTSARQDLSSATLALLDTAVLILIRCHQPVSSSTLPLSFSSALLPTLDWVTSAAYLSPETAVGHIPIDPKSEQISDSSFEVKFCAVVGQSLHTVAIGSCNDGEFECHQPVSSSTLPLSFSSALLPTLDWVTSVAYLSPETAVGHIPIDPKSEQISDSSFEVKFCAVVGQSLHIVPIGSCNDGEFEVRFRILNFE